MGGEGYLSRSGLHRVEQVQNHAVGPAFMWDRHNGAYLQLRGKILPKCQPWYQSGKTLLNLEHGFGVEGGGCLR